MSEMRTQTSTASGDAGEEKKEIRLALWVRGKMLVRAESRGEAIGKVGMVGKPVMGSFFREGLAARTSSWEVSRKASSQWRVSEALERAHGLYEVTAEYAFLSRFLAKTSTPRELIEKAMNGVFYTVGGFERQNADVDVSGFTREGWRYADVQILGEIVAAPVRVCDESEADAPMCDGPTG